MCRCVKNEHVSTVITGATKPEQVRCFVLHPQTCRHAYMLWCHANQLCTSLAAAMCRWVKDSGNNDLYKQYSSSSEQLTLM